MELSDIWDTDDRIMDLMDDKVIWKVTNPQLRQMLTSQLNSCINDHFKLSDMAISKGWYPAYATPEEQLKNDLTKADKVIKEG